MNEWNCKDVLTLTQTDKLKVIFAFDFFFYSQYVYTQYVHAWDFESNTLILRLHVRRMSNSKGNFKKKEVRFCLPFKGWAGLVVSHQRHSGKYLLTQVATLPSTRKPTHTHTHLNTHLCRSRKSTGVRMRKKWLKGVWGYSLFFSRWNSRYHWGRIHKCLVPPVALLSRSCLSARPSVLHVFFSH